MSHWAQIDENNIVINVTVGNDEDMDEGYQWLMDNIGGRWIKTSINTYGGAHFLGGTPLRKNYAGIGFTYDEDIDAFVPPKPDQYPSFVIDAGTGLWTPPVPKPDNENVYGWNEEEILWQLIPQPFPSWTISNAAWVAPVGYPTDNAYYEWNEANQSWDILGVLE
jgi:hypothetical protein